MHSIREYGDSDDDPTELEGGPPTFTTQISLSSQMAATSVSTTKPLTDAEIDAALLDYEDDSGGVNVEANATSKTVTACGKHPDCLHSKGDKHPGRCIWYDEDLKRRCIIPDDAAGWAIAKPMKIEEKVKVNAKPRDCVHDADCCIPWLAGTAGAAS